MASFDIIPDGPPLEQPEPSAATAYATIPPPFGQYLGVQAGSTLRSLGRVVEQGARQGSDWFSQWLYGAATAEAGISGNVVPEPGTVPSGPVLSPQEYNERYAPTGPDGNPVSLGSSPMPDDIARSIGEARREEIERQNVMARFENAHAWPTNFAAGTLGFMLDPLRASTAFVPGIGEEAILARLGAGFAARAAARLTAGAVTGAVAQLSLSALEYGLSREEAGDYDLRSAFRDMAFAAAGNAIFHTGIGTIGDIIHGRATVPTGINPREADALARDAASIVQADAQTKQAAMATSVGEMVEGRPVNVEPMFQLRTPEPIEAGGRTLTFLEPPARPRTPADVVAEQRDQAISGSAPGVPAEELRQATADAYQPPKVPPGETVSTEEAQGGARPAPTEQQRAVPVTVAHAQAPELQRTIGRQEFNRLLDANARDMGKASDQLADELDSELKEGKSITLYADGKPVPIVAINRGMMQDAEGQRWGTMGIATDRAGENRIEITKPVVPAKPVADPELAAAQERVAGITNLLPEERAELDAAHAGIETADRRAQAIDEAGACLKEAGA